MRHGLNSDPLKEAEKGPKQLRKVNILGVLQAASEKPDNYNKLAAIQDGLYE
jgi:hypothetical protein